MWITREQREFERNQLQRAQDESHVLNLRLHDVEAQNKQLEIRVSHLVSTLDWFKHRLTQVEMERAQLIYAATGGRDPMPSQVKMAVPNFVGEPLVSDVLNAQNNPFGTMGDDSLDPADQIPEQVQHMPGYRE